MNDFNSQQESASTLPANVVNGVFSIKQTTENSNFMASAINQQFTICNFNSAKDNAPKPASLTWAQFRVSFSEHRQQEQKDGPAWSPVSYIPRAKRGNEFVEQVYFAVIDVDNGVPLDEVLSRFEGLAYLAHSSHSHTVETPKYRVILPLAAPVAAAEWHVVWARINQLAGGCNDPATKDSSRVYYKPSHPAADKDVHFVRVNEGRLLSISDLPELAIPVNEQKMAFHRRVGKRCQEIEGIESNGPDLNFEQGLAHVVERCKFMQFASAQDNQSELPEPLWMAMISNACRFENSEPWIHASSSKHSGYDEGATDGKIDHVRNGSAPVTCARIRELGFQDCPNGGCRKPNGQVTAAPAGLYGWMFQRQLSAEQTTNAPLPDEYEVTGGFKINPAGVFKIGEDRDGEPSFLKLASRIDVTALTRDPESSNWGTELQFMDPDHVVKTWALPRELLASTGESYRASLLRMGVAIEPSKQAKEGLAAYLIAAAPESRALSVTQPGWSNGLFVLPNAVYGRSTERMVFQTKDPDEIKRFSQSGTLESWKENVAGPSRRNSRAVASICIGLAPPLLSLIGEDNGGFHLRGNSSTGKTVCLAVGASVWGGRQLIRTWNMTTNGFEGAAAMHNDLLLPLDELGQADGKAAGEAAYMLGNGLGKARADKNGGARAVKRFRNLVLSSGEKSLSDMMEQSGQMAMAGQEIRMVEIAADAGCGYGIFEDIHGAKNSQVFAEALKNAVTQHHGHAGRAFVQVLTDTELQARLVEKVKTLIERFVNKYVPVGATGQVGRVGRRFGLVAAAGELCTELGILPWPEGEAFDGCSKCFEAWIELRGGVGCHEADQAISKVKRFIELHGESRFSPWIESIIGIEENDNNGQRKTIQRAGFRQVTGDGGTEYYMLPEVYRTEICAGLNAKFVTAVLVEHSFLATDKRGSAQVEKTLPGIGKKRVYHLKGNFMKDAFSLTDTSEKVVSMPNVPRLVTKYTV